MTKAHDDFNAAMNRVIASIDDLKNQNAALQAAHDNEDDAAMEEAANKINEVVNHLTGTAVPEASAAATAVATSSPSPAPAGLAQPSLAGLGGPGTPTTPVPGTSPASNPTNPTTVPSAPPGVP